MTANRKRLLLTWVSSLILMIVLTRPSLLSRVGLPLSGAVGFLTFLSFLVFIPITIYLIALAVRYILRKLFWRVGRRLALSYFLIGMLPFVFFAIMLAVMGYLMGGVLSRATLRNERQAMLSKMDRWNLEYALTGRRPPDQLSTMKIIEANGDAELPQWVSGRNFSGLVSRDEGVSFVSSRIYQGEGQPRSIVFMQPVDENWAAEVEGRSGMIVSNSRGTEKDDDGDSAKKPPRRRGRIEWQDARGHHEITGASDEDFDDFFRRAFRPSRIIWADISGPLVDWKTGEPNEKEHLLTWISNPISNIVNTYGGSEYVRFCLAVTGGIGGLLLVIYFFATLFAGVLIFSISRAVNRIEKGTKAVEHGDFSYRIRMQPRNQLGEVANSFDRMTESIGSLLTKVAGQERLQSEIDIAASIQRNLLPKEGPTYKGVSFSAHFQPTASIGGDYYDVFNLDRSRLAVAIGDVSGHGLSTGLVMAMVKAALTTLVDEGVREEALFHRLNDLVLNSTEKRSFMTLGFTIFDLDNHSVRHTNSGHLYPYILRAGQPVLAIETPSLPLGVRQSIEPHTVERTLVQNDTFVYLSDGIVEAQNKYGDPFGFLKLEEVLASVAGQAPGVVQEAILAAVAEHSGSHPPDDDRTIMVLRFDEIGRFLAPHPDEIIVREKELG